MINFTRDGEESSSDKPDERKDFRSGISMLTQFVGMVSRAYISGAPLAVGEGSRSSVLHILHFNEERKVAFGQVVSDSTGALKSGSLVKITWRDGTFRLSVVTQAQLETVVALCGLSHAIVQSLKVPSAGYDMGGMSILNLNL